MRRISLSNRSPHRFCRATRTSSVRSVASPCQNTCHGRTTKTPSSSSRSNFMSPARRIIIHPSELGPMPACGYLLMFPTCDWSGWLQAQSGLAPPAVRALAGTFWSSPPCADAVHRRPRGRQELDHHRSRPDSGDRGVARWRSTLADRCGGTPDRHRGTIGGRDGNEGRLVALRCRSDVAVDGEEARVAGVGQERSTATLCWNRMTHSC